MSISSCLSATNAFSDSCHALFDLSESMSNVYGCRLEVGDRAATRWLDPKRRRRFSVATSSAAEGVLAQSQSSGAAPESCQALALLPAAKAQQSRDAAAAEEAADELLFFCLGCMMKQGEYDPGNTGSMLEFNKKDGLCIYCMCVNICLFPWMSSKAGIVRCIDGMNTVCVR